MPSKPVQVAVLGLGAAVGVYYGQVGYQIAQVAREESRLRVEASSEEAAAQKCDREQQVEVATVSRLEEQLQLQAQDLKTLEGELAAARQRVAELEDMHSVRSKAVAETQGAIEQAQSKMAWLLEEVKRHREHAALAQQALRSAHMAVEEKRQLANPLNHPMVKGLLHSK